VLIRSTNTLVSAGTERVAVEFGKAGWLGKARQQPDRVQMVLAKARTDAEALIERRSRMAEEKIASEERAAVDQLRAAVADAATRAAARLIAEQHDAKSDEPLVNQAIKEIAGR